MYVCMYVCVCVRHAQKIAKLFFSVRITQLPFKLNLVFWGPRSFQFDLEMNINIYCMHYIIKEDYWRP